MAGSRKRLAILGCALVVAIAVSGCGADTTSNASTGLDGSTTSVRSPEVRALARQYSALADEMNQRMAPIQAQGAQLTGPAMNIPAAKSLMSQQATIIREFDAKVMQLAIPDRVRPDVQAVVDADEQIATGLDQMVASTSCAESCTAYARVEPFYSKRTAALVRLRAELGLPAPRQPGDLGTPSGSGTQG